MAVYQGFYLGKMLGNEGKNGITGYPFVLATNTYGCWYYPDSHANKNYAGSAFWGAASSEAQMRDPDPGAAHHVRLKCEGGAPPDAYVAAPGSPLIAVAPTKAIPPVIKATCNVQIAVCESANLHVDCIGYVAKRNEQCKQYCTKGDAADCVYTTGSKRYTSFCWTCG
jgi:hypothetical protein